MMTPTDTVLVIAGESGTEVPDALVGTLRETGLALHHAKEASGVETLKTWMANDKPLPAVVLLPSLKNPLSIARQVHRVAPLVQFVFLVGEGDDRLRHELRLAPMIGNHWVIADPGADSLPRILAEAVRATRQRSNLRTTLDRMNLQIQEQSATDGDALRRLVVSDRHLASILEYAEDAIVSVDHTGTIATWNRGATNLFGREHGAAVGTRIDALVADELAHELTTLMRKARAGQPVVRHEMGCLRADGTTFDAELTLAPVRDEDGRAISISVIARDVTDRKRYEARVDALNDQLAQRVRDMHAANAALKEALERLEASKYELLDLNRKLELQATTDPLTGLKNRIVFQNSIHEMVAFAERQGTPLSILIVDVDHFKRVNDTLGHIEGDRVLRVIADGLRAHTREQDVVARYGGEEFVVLLPNTTAADASTVAKALRTGCRDAVRDMDLTVSIGVATYRKGESDTVFVQRTDAALYRSKDLGRNRVTHAEDMKGEGA